MPSSERDIPFYRQNNIYIYVYIILGKYKIVLLFFSKKIKLLVSQSYDFVDFCSFRLVFCSSLQGCFILKFLDNIVNYTIDIT